MKLKLFSNAYYTIMLYLIFDSSKFNFDNLTLCSCQSTFPKFFLGPRASQQRCSELFFMPLAQSDDAILPHPLKPCQQQKQKKLIKISLFFDFFYIFANTRQAVSNFMRFIVVFNKYCGLFFYCFFLN